VAGAALLVDFSLDPFLLLDPFLSLDPVLSLDPLLSVDAELDPASPVELLDFLPSWRLSVR
jgi:hypothetical protein